MRNSEIRYARVMRDVGWMREGTRRDGVGGLRERYRNHDAVLFSKTHQRSSGPPLNYLVPHLHCLEPPLNYLGTRGGGERVDAGLQRQGSVGWGR